MSTYTDWSKLCGQYDHVRKPIGAHLYLGLAYEATGKTVSHLNILDAGCGTGNHVEYLISKGLEHATMFDAHDGMLNQAREKLKNFVDHGNIVIEKNLLPEIPYESESFDVVMFNQVLHHLVKDNDPEYVNVRKALKEAYRVLKPKGLVVATGVTRYQVRNGYWISSLIPKTIDRIVKRAIEPFAMDEIFTESGFARNSLIIEPRILAMKPDHYFQIDGPLYDDWLNTNSMTAKANIPHQELEEMRGKVSEMKEAGTLEKFVKECDSMRENVGQYALFYAVKE